MDAETWAQEQIEEGASLDTIRARLREAGWSERQIDSLLADLPASPPPKLDRKNLLTYLILFLLTSTVGYAIIELLQPVLSELL